MTAEVAVMNRHAIALAADSAVTIESSNDVRKAWQSANKIFGLSHRHPVGIMVYGSSEAMGVPWDTVIKMYRERLGDRSFARLSDYTDDFIQFAETSRQLFPADVQESWFEAIVAGSFRMIIGRIVDELNNQFPQETPVTTADIRRVVDDVVAAVLANLEGQQPLGHVTQADLEKIGRKYGQVIARSRKEVFQHLPLSSATSRKLRRFVLLLFARATFSDIATGVVIAGYGDNDVFPSFDHLTIEGVMADRLNYDREETVAVTHQQGAFVRAFAQREMVFQFMEGVDPRYQDVVEGVLRSVVERYPRAIVDNIPRMSRKRKEALKSALDSVAPTLVAELEETLQGVRARH